MPLHHVAKGYWEWNVINNLYVLELNTVGSCQLSGERGLRVLIECVCVRGLVLGLFAAMDDAIMLCPESDRYSVSGTLLLKWS